MGNMPAPMRAPLLLGFAGRVRPEYDADPEGDLCNYLKNWLQAGDDVRRRTENPHALILGSELMPTLAARLCASRWGDVVFGMIGDDSPADGVNSALSLLMRLFSTVHDGDWSVQRIEPKPNARVLPALLRQVCICFGAAWTIACRPNISYCIMSAAGNV